MRKENDREVLISAWENEKNEERDCFDFISGKVMEYKIRYGEDEFIIDFKEIWGFKQPTYLIKFKNK